jgi:proteasome lid subunit RPN8/RPN11
MKQDIEWGGFLDKNASGSYLYSSPFSGTQIALPSFYTQYNQHLQSLPNGFSVAGWYHSQPPGPTGYNPELFSGGDVAASRYIGGPGFLITPRHKFLRLNLNNGKPTQTYLPGKQVCGGG